MHRRASDELVERARIGRISVELIEFGPSAGFGFASKEEEAHFKFSQRNCGI